MIYRLYRAGHVGYIVGGGVRDLLLGRQPKDYDIGTDASPSRLRRIFRNSRVVGRRFKIVHVWFREGKVVEVTTFRRNAQEEPERSTVVGENGILWRDNTFGTPAEDAFRRDLTINGMFYDPASNTVIDYVNGLADLEAGIIRTIGDPVQRFTEDPVRIIRAIRHAARAGFTIEPRTYEAMLSLTESLQHCSQSRLSEEFMKDIRSRAMSGVLKLMMETGVFAVMSPTAVKLLQTHYDRLDGSAWEMTLGVVKHIDDHPEHDQISEAVRLAAMFFPLTYALSLTDQEEDSPEALPRLWERAVHRDINPIAKEIGVTRRMADAYTTLLSTLWRAFARSPKCLQRMRGKAYAADFCRLVELLQEAGVITVEMDRIEALRASLRPLHAGGGRGDRQRDGNDRPRRGRRGGRRRPE